MQDKFKYRSHELELLDAPDVPKKVLFQNLRELDFINRVLGGFTISLKGIKELVTERKKTYHIVDLGCGSGYILKCIARWARINGYKVSLTGVDKNPDVIQFMKESCKNYLEINSVVDDYSHYLTTVKSIDIIHCSLFCHHLSDEELITLFGYFQNSIKTGFVINDLQRNRLAYYSVQLITHLLNGSYLSKNDGPVSILRSFKSNELRTLLQKANMKNYSISWKWAFRYLIVGNQLNYIHTNNAGGSS
jgi:2-polyprenyl-3-methyl-5-hydroxy-6-metoxy-1,4-benzoquinol methylase